MKFVFRTLMDHKEKAAKSAAEKIAGILKSRGHEVRIVPTPRKFRHSRLVSLLNENPSARKKAFSFLVKRRLFLKDLNERGDEDEHVIDVHNSAANKYTLEAPESLRTDGITVFQHEDRSSGGNVSDGTPPYLVLHNFSSPSRLVATLELPAVKRELKGRPRKAEKNARDVLSKIEDEIHEGGHENEPRRRILNSIYEFGRKMGFHYPVRETEQAGLLTPGFLEKVADELESFGRDPGRLLRRKEPGRRFRGLSGRMNGKRDLTPEE